MLSNQIQIKDEQHLGIKSLNKLQFIAVLTIVTSYPLKSIIEILLKNKYYHFYTLT